MKYLITLLLLIPSLAFGGNVDLKANKDGSISAQVKGGDNLEIPYHEVTPIDPTTDADVTAGSCLFHRLGTMVTMICKSFTHSTLATVIVNTIVPSELRPKASIENLFYYDGSTWARSQIQADGDVLLYYSLARNNSITGFSITYNLD